jgi:hypothetical protein
MLNQRCMTGIVVSRLFKLLPTIPIKMLFYIQRRHDAGLYRLH